jgi:hypothetical protein
MTDPVTRARRAAQELLDAYAAAQDTTTREDVARVIAALTPGGGASIAELADRALSAARSSTSGSRGSTQGADSSSRSPGR